MNFKLQSSAMKNFLSLDGAKNDAGFTTTYRDDPFFIDLEIKNLERE